MHEVFNLKIGGRGERRLLYDVLFFGLMSEAREGGGRVIS